MKKLLYILLLFPVLLYGQSNNTTNTKFTNGLQVPNGATPKPTSGLTAGALSYVTGVGLQYYDGSAWRTLGTTGGSVTSFSAGNLSPLFTTSVATATTTPALSFSLSNAGASTVFGNNTGGATAPFFFTLTQGDILNLTDTLLNKANRNFDNVAAGAIANAKLANSTISGVALGSNLNSVTFNNSGSGDASGTTYNGGVARTISYNTIGAAPASGGGYVASVSGTTNRITSTGGTAPVIDISSSYVGQSSITTLGTITTGVWNAGAITSSGAGTFSSTVKGTKGIFTTVTGGTAGTDSLLVKKSSDNTTYKISPTYYQVAGGALAGTLTFGTHLSASGTSYNGSSNVTIQSDATSSNTMSTIIARDGSGNFSAGTGSFSAVNTSGIFTSTASAGDIISAVVGAASSLTTHFKNTGGDLIWGINNSSGSSIMTTNNYASYIFTHNATDLVLGTNDAGRLTLSSTGTGFYTGNFAISSNTKSSTLTLTNISGVAGGTDSLLSKNATTNVVTKIPANYYATSASVAGAALTKSDDTNVTLTLGGSPTTALLNAASLSLGWTGTLAVARGGTGTGSAGITALNNITGYSFAGITGNTSTYNIVGSNSPTITNATLSGGASATGGLSVSGGQGRATQWYVGLAAETPPVWNALYSDHVSQVRNLGIVSFRDSVGIIWNNIYSDTPAGNNVLLSNGHGYRIQMTGGNYQFQVSTPGNAGDTKSLTTKVSWDEQGNGTFVGKVTLADEAYSSSWDGKLEAPTKNAVYDAIQSSTYTPTLTNGANVGSTSAQNCTWVRVGSRVFVQGAFTITPTSGSVATTVGISLPVASNFTANTDLNGDGAVNISASTAGPVFQSDAANDRATLIWTPSINSTQIISFSFSYSVL